jgi:hypothetical protein
MVDNDVSLDRYRRWQVDITNWSRPLHHQINAFDMPMRPDDRIMHHDEAAIRFGGIDVCPFCTWPHPGIYMASHSYHVTCTNPRCRADGPIAVDPPTAIILWNERRA